MQILALPELEVLELDDSVCQLRGDIKPMAASTSITRLKLHNCSVHSAFLAALPELRHLKLWKESEDTETVEAVTAALSSLRQLTSVSLYWPCTIPPASLTHLTNLRRLRVHFDEGDFQEEIPEAGGLPPPGDWTSGLESLGITCSIAFRSLDTLRHMLALQHLRLYCSTEERTESAAAWGDLLEAVAANQLLQRIDLVGSDAEEEPVMSNALSGSLLRLQRTHPHLTIACEGGDVLDDWFLSD